MKVLILGGTGVFGERIARLLARDGHQLTIAARSLPAARALAQDLNATALRLDRSGDLAALAGYQVIIDAAGPFHAYVFSPGIWWIGSRMNRSGSDVQILQMYS